MVILKKIKGSTLMETLVATVLIVAIFMIASMVLNNIFSSSIKNSTRAIDTQLYELQYLYDNDKLHLPFLESFGEWQIRIGEFQEKNETKIEFEAVNLVTNKTIIIERYKAK